VKVGISSGNQALTRWTFVGTDPTKCPQLPSGPSLDQNLMQSPLWTPKADFSFLKTLRVPDTCGTGNAAHLGTASCHFGFDRLI
jgi:hypothetical protein